MSDEEFASLRLCVTAFCGILAVSIASHLQEHFLLESSHSKFLKWAQANYAQKWYFNCIAAPIVTSARLHVAIGLVLLACLVACVQVLWFWGAEAKLLACGLSAVRLLACFPFFETLRVISSRCSGHKIVRRMSFASLLFCALRKE